ncbi:chaperone modulator CbpM [Rhodopila sp.]|uniref:chaperone modulator CbpM n=1 Tax=Rhodopila sp. TaxID=2480087 RepID=UPI003D0CC20C
MMRFTAVAALFPDLGETELQAWVLRGWVRPEGAEPDWIFQEIDIARVRLIRDFRHAMAVPEETMPLVLSLLDQVYTLRGQMRAVARAVEGQPEAVRAAIRAALRG